MNDSKKKITDELLAAFLDGNTSAQDTLRVLSAAKHDPELQQTIQIAGEVDDAMVFASSRHARHSLPMTALAARQKENYLCDIECEEFVLRQLGIEATHKTLLDEAYRNCWLKDQGMPLYNIGRLLEKNHLSVSRRYDSTVNDIARLLESGNQLIAVINNALLTQEDPEASTQPNHAVAISSIDLEKGEITLFNPYTEEELTTYRIDSFQRAWEKSHCYLVVTNTTDKFVYEPYPIRLDDVVLDEDLTELQEAIAENAHEIWAKARTEQGWSYGPERNDQKKETPDMVPYCNLPESEKLYDREMAMQTLKLVKKLGFEVKRRRQ